MTSKKSLEFERFESLTKKLVAVPKAEIDAAMKGQAEEGEG